MKKRTQKFSPNLLSVVLLILMVSCKGLPDRIGAIDRQPNIFPDYAGVTIPSNIAPMNFAVCEQGHFRLKISTKDNIIIQGSSKGVFSIPLRKWKRMVESSVGEDICFTVYRKNSEGWAAFEPFKMSVAPEKADSYIAYRLIPPGYVAWKEMGIYQRNIENFRQSEILSNRLTGGNCMNCHSFRMQDPDYMLFHSRAVNAGTMVVKEGTVEKLNTKTPETISALVYPSWHPSGKYVAFSNNDTHQAFFLNNPNRIEVYDNQSDVVVCDLQNHRVISCPSLKGEESFETFPTFSPDGEWLFFCTAEAVDSVQVNYKDVRYSLCKISFDSDKGTFGNSVDTLYNARSQGGSVSFPRVSPDGKFLVFTHHSFGNFSIWHHDADLWCMDLPDGRTWPLEKANSDDTESYHSWSNNGRWMVFSSRRIDGLYTRPYFTYIDREGQASKPFLLPQKNPVEYYKKLRFSYNIPEFVSGKVNIDKRKLVNEMVSSAGNDLNFEWK